MVIPPPPSRRTLGLLALGVLVVAAAIAFGAGPLLRDIRESDATKAASEREQRTIERTKRQRAEQRPRFGNAPQAGRTATLAAIRGAIVADARERFDPPARAATCEPAPGVDVVDGRAVLDCLAITSYITGAGQSGALGIPYRATADYAVGSYAFCKVNPPPGEAAIDNPADFAVLPAACRKPASDQAQG